MRGLSKAFGRRTIFEDLDLTVERGEIIGVVGGSGQGKSVLLRTIIGLEPFTAGTIEVLGLKTARMSKAEREALERRWGVLFQDGALFGGLDVLENIQVPLRESYRLPRPFLDDLARLKLSLVGLAPDAAHTLPAALSGGMRKRAGLARALALDPDIVFLDEPTAGLDPIGAAAFDQLIANLRATLGLTVVMVTHDLDSLFAICDRVAVLADRRIVAVDTPHALAQAPGHPWIAEYFRGPRARGRHGHAAPG